MWKLVFIILAIYSSSLFAQGNTVYFILDHCEFWEQHRLGKNKEYFSIARRSRDWPLISFGHGWIDESDSLTTRKLIYAEIMASEPIFASELTYEDWWELSLDSGPRIFILKPEDYCSDKRFLHNYQFTLYEVNLYVQPSSDDLAPLEIPIAPIPKVDTLKRKKNY